MQIAILGRQPKISLAELESLFGADAITEVADYAALVDVKDPLPQERLGGTIKSAGLLTRLESTNLEGAFAHVQNSMPELLEHLPDGKLQLGVSVYGFKAQKNWLLRQTLSLKKVIKQAGRSVRVIENKTEVLEAAQVLYNKLTGPLGLELLLIKDGDDVLVGQTTGVQNIDDYAKRDFDRPKRDAYVGMLPPKLAQIMINLAVGRETSKLIHQSLEGANSTIQDLRSKICVLDPFCGTGVVLQEALLMGYDAIGSDISDKMVDYTSENLQWILNQVQDDNLGAVLGVEPADATSHTWSSPAIQDPSATLCFVCETYLGKPLTSIPQEAKLAAIIAEADQIATGFLKNIAPQLGPGTRLCLALPAWALPNNKFKHLPVLDQIERMGYNHVDLKHASTNDLIYHRPDQIVARQLTTLEKN